MVFSIHCITFCVFICSIVALIVCVCVNKMQNQAGPGIKKRLACDRCHSRKLRCSGDLDGCSRCVGDNSVCTYSPALKVGRPSKASISPRNPQQQETQSISETAFYDIDALSADSGISMPPSPPQLGESCITGRRLANLCSPRY